MGLLHIALPSPLPILSSINYKNELAKSLNIIIKYYAFQLNVEKKLNYVRN